MTDKLDAAVARAREMLADAPRLAVLTGSGISAESGIQTFRGGGGLWKGTPIEDFATPDGFDRDPVGVWNWYAQRRAELDAARPNAAHEALARLQRDVLGRGGTFTLATQNIDGLHQAAGSTDAIELHGSMRSVRCRDCEHRREMPVEPVAAVPTCPRCGAAMRPDVVWFGEALPEAAYLPAVEAVAECSVLLAVGTSATVYPAAGLIEWAIGSGGKVIELNLEPTPATRMAAVALHGKAGELLPRLA